MKRISTLDGLRAFSIIMVILAHAAPTIPSTISQNILFHYLANSHLGVRIFFVISGYLITKLLLAERAVNGFVNIKQFYIKRAFRIFPVFYLYILVIIGIKVFFISDIFLEYLTPIFAGFYLWNYKQLIYMGIPDSHGGWFFGHFWTLAMEEQFYLIWPLIFNKFKFDFLKKLVVIAICFMPILRILTYLLMPNSRGQIAMMLHTGGDTILIGCLGALMETTGTFTTILKFAQKKLTIIFALTFMLLLSPILASKFGGGYTLSLGISLNNLCIMLFIYYSIYTNGIIYKLLSNKFLIQIGLISYSIYIWQQLFLNNIYQFWFNLFPQNIFIVFIIGFISYYCIEKPILSFRRKFISS